MKRFALTVLPLAMAVLVAAGAPRRARAQEGAGGAAPQVAVVSVASLDKLLQDVDYLAKLGDAADLGNMARGMAQVFTAGLDTTKPAGAVVSVDPQGEPTVIGFVPVTDLKMFLSVHEQRLGKPEDAGDGVLKLAPGKPFFVKQQGAWAFVSDRAENLTALPKDPQKLLAGLDQQYDIAVQAYIQNIPKSLRQKAVSDMKKGMETALEQQQQIAGSPSPVDRQMAENLSRSLLQSMTAWIEESDQVTIGWAVDSTAKSTYLDFIVTAKEGTALARRMALLEESQSEFAGFLKPEAAVTVHSASRIDQEDIGQLTMMLKVIRTNAMAELDKDPDLEDETTRQAAKDVLAALLDVGSATVQEGKMDGGAVLLLAPKAVTFAAGAHVSDGGALEDAFRKLVDAAKGEPDFPEVAFDAETHKDVRFHTMSVPLPDEAGPLKQVLGDRLDVAFGFGEKSFYLAAGNNPLDVLKSIMDQSAADAGKKLPSSQMRISLGPIVQFASSIDPNPIVQALTAALEQAGGKDHISILSQAVPRGGMSRLEVEEGVLRAVGQAVKMAFGGQNGAPPPDGP